MVKSEELYDNFAPYFRSYSKKKAAYIKIIDEIILKNLPLRTLYVADIGSGDGVRGVYLFKRIRGKMLLMIDSSQKMVTLSERYRNKNIEIKKLDISRQLPKKLKGKFDIILCLWNVLGHIPSYKKCLRVMKNMSLMLAPGGKIFIDVSNRYNISHYGIKKVTYNILRDILSPSYSNGNFSYKIPVNKNIQLDSICHFFNPFEMRGIIEKAGLTVKQEIAVNYSRGTIIKTSFGGHLFYILTRF